MNAKKILITGLGAQATEEGIRSWLEAYGPVLRVDIVRDGDAEHPAALIEMGIGDGAAASLVARLADYWHEGQMVNARLLHH